MTRYFLHIQAEQLDIKPLLKCGVAVFKRLDLESYVCNDCDGYEDCLRVYSEIGNDGKNRVYRRCLDKPEEEPVELSLSDVTVYGVSLPALFKIAAGAFGCGDPQTIANMAGAWDFGMSTFAPAKHKRCVFFVRHLARTPESAFAAYPGCIVIAAGGLKQTNADASLFSFEDVFRCDTNGLTIDLDAVSLRFSKRTLENKMSREPNTAMLAKMKSLANYLKDLDAGVIKARRSGTQTAYDQVVEAMSKITKPSLVEFFKSDDAPCKISWSVLHEYLSGQKYVNEPYATAARFWFKVCTKMDVLDATTTICVAHFGRGVTKLPDMEASKVFMEVVKLLPPSIKAKI